MEMEQRVGRSAKAVELAYGKKKTGDFDTRKEKKKESEKKKGEEEEAARVIAGYGPCRKRGRESRSWVYSVRSLTAVICHLGFRKLEGVCKQFLCLEGNDRHK